ncbi:DUF6864 domain-containing function [Prevotella sp. E13-27]|uniref:DUF6864 domain-containing function n=1 Tax=Prevotella sp. E13-27 TaxID=2938122 RepID=UPI00200A1A2B|nr:hypothetical protein [Prevotella sp. E13-27]MCK8623663.1 hypothetical protein [Prevotella sp. E13-27]
MDVIPVQNIKTGDYDLLGSFVCIAGLDEDICWDIHDHTPDILKVQLHFDKDEKEEKAYTKAEGIDNNVLQITVYNVKDTANSMIYMMPIGTYDDKDLYLSYYLEASKSFQARIVTFNLYSKETKDGNK